jgi:hypothetical protein
MAATDILSTSNLQEETSADFTIVAGIPAAIVLKNPELGAIVSIQIKTGTAKYTEIGMISSWSPQVSIAAPGEYRCIRRQGSCGVARA